MPRREEKKFNFIYKTTNLSNGKFYIGMHSTDNLGDHYLGSGKRLRYSIKKHGIKNHKLKILKFLPNRDTLKTKEKEIVNESLLKDPLCMNLKEGGEGGGKLWNKDHAKKFHAAGGKKVFQILSQRHSKKLKTDLKYKERYSQIMKDSNNPGFSNKTHTKETKDLMSKSQKLRLKNPSKNSMFNKCWIFNNELKQNKAISIWEFEEFQKIGWQKGRKIYTDVA